MLVIAAILTSALWTLASSCSCPRSPVIVTNKDGVEESWDYKKILLCRMKYVAFVEVGLVDRCVSWVPHNVSCDDPTAETRIYNARIIKEVIGTEPDRKWDDVDIRTKVKTQASGALCGVSLAPGRYLLGSSKLRGELMADLCGLREYFSLDYFGRLEEILEDLNRCSEVPTETEM